MNQNKKLKLIILLTLLTAGCTDEDTGVGVLLTVVEAPAGASTPSSAINDIYYKTKCDISEMRHQRKLGSNVTSRPTVYRNAENNSIQSNKRATVGDLCN